MVLYKVLGVVRGFCRNIDFSIIVRGVIRSLLLNGFLMDVISEFRIDLSSMVLELGWMLEFYGEILDSVKID